MTEEEIYESITLESRVGKLLDQDNYIISEVKPSDWAESHRVMSTQETNFPGKFNYDKTPYLREIVDCLSPNHPANEVAIMKGAQLGLSTGVLENGIGWIISENPANILLAARDEQLVKKMVDTKVDPMINSCGLRHLIRPNVVRARNQRTGDTSMTKEFAGGSLNAFSIQKPGRMRQVSMKVGFLDDFEAAPVDKDAGDAVGLFRTRFKSFGPNKKIFWISTPEVKQTSNIEPLYMQGDQRKYFVPCPCCGDYIVLEWRTIDRKGKHAGIIYELDEDNELISGSVRYKCQSCSESFTDGHKYEMNMAGEWRPTAKQKDPSFFSYHLSCMYSPAGMNGWEDGVKEYLYACPPGGQINLDRYKVFINTYLGWPWEERGKAPNVSALSRNTRPYSIGFVPRELSLSEGNGEIILLTCACDLNGVVEDGRLDYEIVAWSETGASYSIDHGSVGTFVPLEGQQKNPKPRDHWTYEHFENRNVWDKFLEIITKQYPSDDGKSMYPIGITGIDTGHYTTYANQFVERANKAGLFTIGVKGQGEAQYKKIDANQSIYQRSKNQNDLYHLDVNQIKDELSNIMTLRWIEGDDIQQPNGFMNFPTPSDGKYTMESYFRHYEGEHKIMKKDPNGRELGYMWEKRNMKVMNHFWDVKVYNMAIREIYTELILKEMGIKDPSWAKLCAVFTN